MTNRWHSLHPGLSSTVPGTEDRDQHVDIGQAADADVVRTPKATPHDLAVWVESSLAGQPRSCSRPRMQRPATSGELQRWPRSRQARLRSWLRRTAPFTSGHAGVAWKSSTQRRPVAPRETVGTAAAHDLGAGSVRVLPSRAGDVTDAPTWTARAGRSWVRQRPHHGSKVADCWCCRSTNPFLPRRP